MVSGSDHEPIGSGFKSGWVFQNEFIKAWGVFENSSAPKRSPWALREEYVTKSELSREEASEDVFHSQSLNLSIIKRRFYSFLN